MRKMFARLFGFLFLVVLSVVAFGNNAPPGYNDDLSTVVAPATDNFQINLPAAEIQAYEMYVVEKAAPVVKAPVYGCRELMVPEVTYNMKYSLNIKNAALYCSTVPLKVNCKTISDESMGMVYNYGNFGYQRNYQHTNYGYPLSAD